MKVLIAEDDVTSRTLLEAVLTKKGYEVVSTCDGQSALAALAAPDAPQLAILDWMMPNMDRVEVCRRMRQMDTAQPPYIILLTALGSKEDIVAGLEAGANDYVTKPFNATELQARVQAGQRMLGLQRALAARVEELQEALNHVKTLQGILPICMHCHKIRDDQETWQKLENYIQEHSGVLFSHGLCPECLEKYYPPGGEQ